MKKIKPGDLNESFIKWLLAGKLPSKPEPREDDNVKYAYVNIGDKRVMVGCDTITMKAYKL